MLYIGCFELFCDDLARSLQMLVEAESTAEAVEGFRARLNDVVKNHSEFRSAGEIEVHLDTVIEVKGGLADPIVINLNAYRGSLLSHNPCLDQERAGVTATYWGSGHPESDKDEPFAIFVRNEASESPRS